MSLCGKSFHTGWFWLVGLQRASVVLTVEFHSWQTSVDILCLRLVSNIPVTSGACAGRAPGKLNLCENRLLENPVSAVFEKQVRHLNLVYSMGIWRVLIYDG